MPGFWRKCRTTLRWLRLTVWLVVLAALLAFVWCNRVGLPGFLKARIVASLRQSGVELEFSRMRLSLIHGLVAENVRVGQAQTAASPTFAAKQVQLDFNFPALLRRRWQLDGLFLRGGEFTLPLSPTNALTLTNLQTDLRFQTNGTWSLDHFRAGFAGTRIGISGELAHAPAARNWKLFAGRSSDRGDVLPSLKIFADALRQIHFQGEPQLRLTLNGDAREPHSLVARLSATADGVTTPWFAAQAFRADFGLTAPANAPTNTDDAWGFWTNLQPLRLTWDVRLGKLRADEIEAGNLAVAGVWAAPTLAVTKLTGQLGGGSLSAGATLDVATREVTFTNDAQFDPHALAKFLDETTRGQLAKISFGTPPQLSANGSLRLPPWTNAASDWQSVVEHSLRVQGLLACTNLASGKLKLDTVQTHFAYADELWELPDLTVTQGRTQLRLSGQESDATKNFHALLSGQLDWLTVAALLPNTNALHGFGVLEFHEPLALTADLTGNLRTLETFCATGRVALTNFAIRGTVMDSVAATFCYTNLAAWLHAPELLRAGGTQWLRADEVFLDFRELAAWVTNGTSFADPQPIANAIGPKTGAAMAAVQFLAIPHARVNGSTPIINIQNAYDARHADLTFEFAQPVPFRWAKLQTTNLTGTVHWREQTLVLTNLAATLYDGRGTGRGLIDFRPKTHDFDYDLFVKVTNVNIHLLAADLSTNKNNFEGRLTGAVTVTNASSADWHSWNGYGYAWLRDGQLWDVPIFAFLSPVLNQVSPGLGNNRAREAGAAFNITNGVINTPALQIRTDMMRLQYAGTVDLKQKVNAKVTAQLLRETPFFGSALSLLFTPVGKIFECRVTGQLDNPVVTPVYIPKILLVPLHPIRSVEGLFTPPETKAGE